MNSGGERFNLGFRQRALSSDRGRRRVQETRIFTNRELYPNQDAVLRTRDQNFNYNNNFHQPINLVPMQPTKTEGKPKGKDEGKYPYGMSFDEYNDHLNQKVAVLRIELGLPDRPSCDDSVVVGRADSVPAVEELREMLPVSNIQELEAAARKEKAPPKILSPRSEEEESNTVANNKVQRNMAEERSGDLSHKGFFTVGSHIKCRYQGGHVEGEVAAFQNSSRLLVIRAAASNGKSSSNDVYVINADCVEKISVDDRSSAEVLKPIDFQKLEKRRLKSTGLKKARIRALSADVAPEGRKLFLAITKTIDEVAWDGDKILVLNEVKISPPYRVEDVQGDKEASVVHVKKIVDKHWKEQSPNAGNN